MYKTTAACLLMLATVQVHATLPGPDPDWDQALAIPCPALMTGQECLDHKATLIRLKSETERNAYLTGLAALMRDRVKTCECAMLNIKQ